MDEGFPINAFSSHQEGKHKPIQIGIYDRSSKDGRYQGLTKRNALLQALNSMMYEELLSDSDIRPRFNWNGMVDDVYRCVAADEASAAFLKDRVERMPPPWPGARLEVVYKTNDLTKVEAYVPGPLLFTPTLLEFIRRFDRMIRTPMWQELDIRPHNLGYVYTFAIDADSYKLLDRCNGYIPYHGTGIEFRALSI